MRPYNYKVWAVPTPLMQCKWLGERVATADVRKAIGNVLRGGEDAGWGPNAVFRFPTESGTGAVGSKSRAAAWTLHGSALDTELWVWTWHCDATEGQDRPGRQVVC